MSKYYVTGIWKTSNGIITHILVNTPAENGALNPNKKWTVQEGVDFLSRSGNQLSSATWNYNRATWQEGEQIRVVDNRFLRTVRDNRTNDNLDNLIPMHQLIG